MTQPTCTQEHSAVKPSLADQAAAELVYADRLTHYIDALLRGDRSVPMPTPPTYPTEREAPHAAA